MLDRKSLRQSGVRALVITALALTGWLATAPRARADVAIGADVEGLVPLDLDDVSAAPSFQLRLGLQLHLPLVALTPELGFHYADFSHGPSLYRGFAGARVSLGEIFRFGVDAHVGFGYFDWQLEIPDDTNTGFSLDAGIFLDLTVLPLLDIGVHLGYGRIGGDESVGLEPLQWMAFGAHVTLIL